MDSSLDELIKINNFINNGHCFDEYKGNINVVIHKIVNGVIHKKIENNEKNKFYISRLISRYIGYEDIEFDDNDFIILLDFINWHYPTILQHADDWTSSEEQAGYDFIKILHFSNKVNKKITGLNDMNTLFGILMAVLHCDNDETIPKGSLVAFSEIEKFVLDNNVKMPKSMFEHNGSYDSNMFDIDDWFKQKNYNIIIDQ